VSENNEQPQRKLSAIRIKNFKAVRDSGWLELGPLTVIIGNNGSGKSSLIEALETFQTLVDAKLDAAMNRWRGMEHIRNRAVPHDPVSLDSPKATLPISAFPIEDDEQPSDETYIPEDDLVALYGHADEKPEGLANPDKEINPIELCFRAQTLEGELILETAIGMLKGGNRIFIERENLTLNDIHLLERDEQGWVRPPEDVKEAGFSPYRVPLGESVITASGVHDRAIHPFGRDASSWQFMLLNPDVMGSPVPPSRTGGVVRLARNGSNIAEYILDIQRYDVENETYFLPDIIDTLKYVLPYADDVIPSMTQELERTAYFQLREGGFDVPAWLLSTGSLRILALLAVLRHPTPPPLIVIEEIENGLDPRTISLVVEEIRSLTTREENPCQVIITTHSPYLLNQLGLDEILLVERINGQPVFFRPGEDERVQIWAKNFAPGDLYTMSQLTSQKDEE